MNRPLLLNPGPVTLSERVRNSLLLPDLCHREPEFFDLQDEIRARLLQVHALDPSIWAAVLLTGSGTAAVEAMVSSLVPQDGQLLVLENGVYGERITRIAQIHRIDYETLAHDWTAAIDLDRLRGRLGQAPVITHVAVVHHETTTGRLNDLSAIAAVCAEFGVSLLVDAVSSFGAELLEFAPAITAIAATANKCLHGVPGAAFVILRRSALAAAPTRSLYLDLAGWCREQDRRSTPFTPSVHAYYALREALREFDDAGGLQARHRQYGQLADQAADGLQKLGILPLMPARDASVVLRAYRLPACGYARLHDELKAQGFIIYAGQGTLSRQLFRISTMGAVAAADVARLLAETARIVA